jgi:hypothetical protein
MKKILSGLMGILAAFFVLSCQSTGDISAAEGPVVAGPAAESASGGKNAQTPLPAEDRPLAEIYDRHENKIILTGAKVYTVIWGDTLSKIARRYYGTGDNPYYFPLIIAASREDAEIPDPDLIKGGMRLTIPSLRENLNDPGARANLKNLLKDVADFYAGKSGARSRGLYDGLMRLYNTL